MTLTFDGLKKLDAVLRRYHEMGRKKQRRVLEMVSNYVPDCEVQHVFDRNIPKEVPCNMYGSDKTFDQWVKEASVKEPK